MVSLGLIAKVESLRDAATIESTSQRLSSQVGQVVNRARDILRYNSSTFSRNASTSFRTESTLHSSFPKILRLARASRYRNVLPKEVCKTVVHMEKTLSSNENPLTHDEIICFAEVNFLSKTMNSSSSKINWSSLSLPCDFIEYKYFFMEWKLNKPRFFNENFFFNEWNYILSNKNTFCK